MSGFGSLQFAKYAYSPNKLKYCGPDDNRSIFEYCVAKQSDAGLINLLKGFEGAFPYLQLIAKSNNILDSFDERVVEAYWVGNDLLNRVSTKDFYESIKNRFGKKIPADSLRWLLSKPPVGAKPHHSFHVLDVYTKTGLIRSGMKSPILETINNCLIMWGEVIQNAKFKSQPASPSSIQGGNDKSKYKIIIRSNPIIMEKSKLAFGAPIKLEVDCPFVCPQVGDWVSLHWGNVCDILKPDEVANLKKWTNYHIKIANTTI